MTPIDLRLLGKYRIDRDPAYAAEYGANGRTDDLWLLTIPCQHGEIYPHAVDRLGFATRNRGPIAKQLTALPGVRIEQEGSDGFNVSFPVSQFKTVAKLVGAKRKREMTPEQKAIAAERLAKYRFSSADNGPKSGQESTRSNTAAL